MCEICLDTGWYGDNGPGRKGNGEFMSCDCDPMLRAQRKLAAEFDTDDSNRRITVNELWWLYLKRKLGSPFR